MKPVVWVERGGSRFEREVEVEQWRFREQRLAGREWGRLDQSQRFEKRVLSSPLCAPSLVVYRHPIRRSWRSLNISRPRACEGSAGFGPREREETKKKKQRRPPLCLASIKSIDDAEKKELQLSLSNHNSSLSPCQRRHDLIGLARAVIHHQITRALECLHRRKVREEEDFASECRRHASARRPSPRRSSRTSPKRGATSTL